MKPEKRSQQIIRPPRWVDRILQWFCSSKVIETLQGDLHELYHKRTFSQGKLRADFYFLLEVLDVCRPFAFSRKSKSNNSNYIAMLNNYFKIAWRNLFKYKMYSGLKIGGFAIGISTFLLISIFVKDELSYDKNYKNGHRIYRVLNVSSDPSDPGKGTAFPAEIAAVIRDNFPEVEKAGRIIPYPGWWDSGNNQFRREEKKQNTYEEGFAYLDQDLLEIFEIPMVYGDRTRALEKPNSMVISKSKADKYFPGEDPVGQTIILNEDESTPFLIGGVMEDFHTNAHLQFDFFITLTGKEFWPGEQTNWCCWNYNPYVRLKPGTNPKELGKKLVVLMNDYILPYRRERGNVSAEEDVKYHSFELQPISEIYLNSADIHDPAPRGDIRVVWLFVAIAVCVLLLACINFINLSTAKSANRAKEVGLRKAVGSVRWQLVQQFLTESMLFSGISVILGVILSAFLLPFFNQLAGKTLEIPWTIWWFAPGLVLFTFFIGGMAGLYPSFYLSAFRPIDVLKGSLSRGSKSSSLRGAMVIFQFTTSIVLIVGAIMVHRQMDFILNKKLGFDKNQVLMIRGANTLGDKLEVFKKELLAISDVQNAAVSDYLPITGTKRDGNSFWKDGRDKLDKSISAQRWRVDKDYINTMGMQLLEGRYFGDMASDSSAIIINQTMVRELSLKNPIGAKIMNWQTWNVIGVVEDFHFESMRQEEIGSLSLVRENFGSVLSVKLSTNDMVSAMASISKKWEEFMPNQHLRYNFLDDSYAQMYDDVKRTGNVFSTFAILAIIVASLGLFGLSAFMVEQRNKEISIRKVLGASLQVIFQLLTFNFLKMIFISLIIAIPLGYLMMEEWLADFKYSIPISWDVFAIAGLMVMFIAMSTISYESIKAAIVNPTKGLRAE